jgi:hypothetical protein
MSSLSKDQTTKKYSVGECKGIVKNTLEATYAESHILLPFFVSFTKMVECGLERTSLLEIKPIYLNTIKTCSSRNPFEIKSFIENCSLYCSMFDTTNFNPVIDGFINELREIALVFHTV